MLTQNVSQSIITLMKQRLAEDKAFHEKSTEDRMAIIINQAAKTIEFDVTIRNNSFLAAFIDWRRSSTLGPASVEKVKDLAIKLINAHDKNMVMYK
jgi:hypothetical protein